MSNSQHKFKNSNRCTVLTKHEVAQITFTACFISVIRQIADIQVDFFYIGREFFVLNFTSLFILSTNRQCFSN